MKIRRFYIPGASEHYHRNYSCCVCSARGSTQKANLFHVRKAFSIFLICLCNFESSAALLCVFNLVVEVSFNTFLGGWGLWEYAQR